MNFVYKPAMSNENDEERLSLSSDHEKSINSVIESPKMVGRNQRDKALPRSLYKSKDSTLVNSMVSLKELTTIKNELITSRNQNKNLTERLEKKESENAQLRQELSIKVKGLEEARQRERNFLLEVNKFKSDLLNLSEEREKDVRKIKEAERENKALSVQMARLQSELKTLAEREKQTEATYLDKIDTIVANYERVIKGTTNREEKKEILIEQTIFDPFLSEVNANVTFRGNNNLQDSPSNPNDFQRSIRIDESFTIEANNNIHEKSSKFKDEILGLFNAHRNLMQSFKETKSFSIGLEKQLLEKENIIGNLKKIINSLSKQLQEACESKENTFSQIQLIKQAIFNKEMYQQLKNKGRNSLQSASDDLDSLMFSDKDQPKPKLTRNNTDLALKDIVETNRMNQNAPRTFTRHVTAKALGKEESHRNRTSNYKEREETKIMTDNLQLTKMRNTSTIVRRSENCHTAQKGEVAEFFRDFNQRSSNQPKNSHNSPKRPKSLQSYDYNEDDDEDHVIVEIEHEERIGKLETNNINPSRKNRNPQGEGFIDLENEFYDGENNDLLIMIEQVKNNTQAKLRKKNKLIKIYKQLFTSVFESLNTLNSKIRQGDVQNLNLDNFFEYDNFNGLNEINRKAFSDMIDNLHAIFTMIEKGTKRLVAVRDIHFLSKLLKPVIDSKYYQEKIRSIVIEDISRLTELVNDDSKIEQSFREISKLEDRISKIVTSTISPNKETVFSRTAIDPAHTIKQLERVKEDESWKSKIRAMLNFYFDRTLINQEISSNSSIENFAMKLKEVAKKVKSNSQNTFRKISDFIQSRRLGINFNTEDLNECIKIYYYQTKEKSLIEEECWTLCLEQLKSINSEVSS
jgi:hypothetical protein